jgi:hypothetical protein
MPDEPVIITLYFIIFKLWFGLIYIPFFTWLITALSNNSIRQYATTCIVNSILAICPASVAGFGF